MDMKKYILAAVIIIFIGSLSAAISAQAADKWTPPNIQIPIPNLSFSAPEQCGTQNGQPVYCVKWIGEYLAAIYKYGIGIIGIVAAIAMMIGGVRWLTAGGNPSSVKDAQSWIAGAITGLILALTSYLILNQINPALLNFQPIKVQMVAPVTITGGGAYDRYNNCKWTSSECGSLGLSPLSDEAACSSKGAGACTKRNGTELDSPCADNCCCSITAQTGCSWKADCAANDNNMDAQGVEVCGTSNYGYHCCCSKAAQQSSPKNCGCINWRSLANTSTMDNSQCENFFSANHSPLVGCCGNIIGQGVDPALALNIWKIETSLGNANGPGKQNHNPGNVAVIPVATEDGDLTTLGAKAPRTGSIL
jgi:hypothetical protein